MAYPGGLEPAVAERAANKFAIFTKNRQFQYFNQKAEQKWNGPFFFLQAADTQLGMMANFTPKPHAPVVEQVAKWDQEINLMERIVAAANIMQPKPRFLIVCGDLIDAMPWVPFRPEQVRDYKAVMSRLDPEIPPICVCGNHDVGDQPTPASIQRYKTDFGDDFFSFWVGGVKFLVVNSQFYMDSSLVPKLRDEHEIWLDEELKSDRKWKHLIGLQHIAPFVHDKNEDFVTLFGTKKTNFHFAKDVRFEFLEKLKKAGMAKLFCGHFHQNAGCWDEKLEVVLTSAVGCQLGQDDHGLRVVSVFEDRIEHKYYALGDIPSSIDL